jgi:hypothetical protein
MADEPIKVRLNDGPIEIECDLEIEEGWVRVRMDCGGFALTCLISPSEAARFARALLEVSGRRKGIGT